MNLRTPATFSANHQACDGTLTRRQTLCALLAAGAWSALQPLVATANPVIPGAPQAKPIAIVKATLHPASSAPIADGTIVFDQGKIVALGKDLEPPADAVRIDGQGKHVYPGLFDALNNVGLVEINSVRATKDDVEVGELNPNVRAQVAVNPDSEIIPTTRSNGVLLTLAAPSGGLMSGRSAVLQLDGWTWEDLTLKADVALHIQWPAMTPTGDPRDKQLEQLVRTLEQARAYAKARQADPDRHPLDLRYESLQPVLQGKMPIIAHADEAQQIKSAVGFARQQGLKLIIYGGYDAPRCADLLKQNQVPVILEGTYRLPMRRSDEYDAAYTAPERLRAAGVTYCIASSKGHGASNARNLPYQAGTAVAYGLPHDEALKAITLYPAQILGVADKVGSLEVGKDATLFIADGDPLETPTQVLDAYIQGRLVSLDDRHKALWRKYQEKYRRQK